MRGEALGVIVRGAILAATALFVLAGCASAPKPIARTEAPAKIEKAPIVVSDRPGGYYKDDGPGANPPPNLGASPDATPKPEPLHKFANRPYAVLGQTYTPDTSGKPYQARGIASWYGDDFHGRYTANGEIFDMESISAAHPTLPLPSYVRVTSLDNGRSVVVRINDRGPFVQGRVVDLSYRAAEILGYVNRGMGNVQVQYVGPAPLNGDDTKMLLASINRPTAMEQGATRFAMVEPRETLDPFAEGEVRVSNGRINFADHEAAQQQTSKGSYSSKDLAEDFFGLFGYAANDAVSGAHAAANVEAVA